MDPASVNCGFEPAPVYRPSCMVPAQCRAITVVRPPIISTASGFSTRTARRRSAGANCCAGSSTDFGAAPKQAGQNGRHRLMPTARRRVSKAATGAYPMSVTPAGSFRRPVSISCSTRCGRSVLRRSPLSGRNGSTIRGSRSRTCLRSMPCWCHMATTIIWMSLHCRGLPPLIVRVSSRRSATTPSCEVMIRKSEPRPTIGKIGWISAGE